MKLKNVDEFPDYAMYERFDLKIIPVISWILDMMVGMLGRESLIGLHAGH